MTQSQYLDHLFGCRIPIEQTRQFNIFHANDHNQDNVCYMTTLVPEAGISG